jgi:hypothetical protein
MTDKEIFELAEEYGEWDDFGRWTFRTDDKLLRFVMRVQEAEREACASLCSSVAAGRDAEAIEEAIRARGEI